MCRAPCNPSALRLVSWDVTPSEQASFTDFVRQEGDGLARYARLLFADAGAAEDALQVALVRVARQWHRGLQAPRAYVRTALRNLALDERRRRHLVPVPSDDEPVAAAVPDHAEAHAAAALLDEVLAALPPRQRATVVLRVVEGLSEAEAAAVLRCTAGTVKSNLSRGLARLRVELDARTATTERTSS